MAKKQTSSLLKLMQIFFYVDAAFWLVFGALDFGQAMTGTSDLRLILSVLMVANGAVLAWFGALIIRARTRIFFLAILYMALNVVLSITDQFGLVDALILLLNLIVLGLLIVTQQRMKRTGKASSGEE